MKSYAFPVEPDDINNVLLELRNIGATWGWGRDPVDHFNAHIKHRFNFEDGIALYIEEENSQYRISFSSITYLKEEFPSESDDFTIIDSFYSIPELASYPDLEDNMINFCEI